MNPFKTIKFISDKTPDTKVPQEWEYKSDGEHIEHYYNGPIKSVTNYKDGLKHGMYYHYNSKGVLHYSISFKNNLMDGMSTAYNTDNKKITSTTEYVSGEYYGDHTEYYENGNIKIKCHYKNGILDGQFIRYQRDGTIVSKNWYNGGLIDNSNEPF